MFFNADRHLRVLLHRYVSQFVLTSSLICGFGNLNVGNRKKGKLDAKAKSLFLMFTLTQFH